MATVLRNPQVLAQSVQVRRSPHPPYLVPTGEDKANIKLMESSWMATPGWLLAIIELPESWYRARGWRRWGYCMATMLPNIALFAETGQRGALNPLCLVAASEYRATRELVEDSWMATMGVLHGYYVAEYCIICRAGTMGGHSTHSA
jgi:hypothetical protein